MEDEHEEAVRTLEDLVTKACSRVDEVLDNEEIARQLHRIARDIKENGL